MGYPTGGNRGTAMRTLLEQFHPLSTMGEFRHRTGGVRPYDSGDKRREPMRNDTTNDDKRGKKNELIKIWVIPMETPPTLASHGNEGRKNGQPANRQKQPQTATNSNQQQPTTARKLPK